MFAISPLASAVEDQGDVLLFEPSGLEVHRRTAAWFWDQEIFDFVGDHLYLIDEPFMRDYYRAWELKRAGMDWQGPLGGRGYWEPSRLLDCIHPCGGYIGRKYRGADRTQDSAEVGLAIRGAETAEFPLVAGCRNVLWYNWLRYAASRLLAKTGCSFRIFFDSLSLLLY